METAIPLVRQKHKITIEFEIDVAYELTDQMHENIGRYMHSLLDYPQDILGMSCYSFNRPEAPEVILVNIQKCS